MSDPVLGPISPTAAVTAPTRTLPATSLVPNPRLVLDPKTHRPVLEYYDPATRASAYIPGSASADFPSPKTDLTA